MTPPPDRAFTRGPLAGLSAWTVAIPMALRYRRLRERRAVLLRGPAGWGEFSPFDEYDDTTAARWLASARESAVKQLPPPRRDRIPVNVTVPPIGAEQARRLVANSGCHTAKVKVAEAGQHFSADVARVAAVREALGDSGFLRIDVNGAWGVDEAEACLGRLAQFDLQYVEQPCATLLELAELRPRTNVPIAADESIRSGASPEEIVDSGAVDMLVMKGAAHGRRCPNAGLGIARRSCSDSLLGIGDLCGPGLGTCAAAALPELPYACGLATVSLLAGDVVRHPLAPDQGKITLRRPTPAPELLERWRPKEKVASIMIARLERVAAVLKDHEPFSP